ncbi:MAG: cupin domain-containing protein [Chloroflexi bacterium]|nr:cupin domain-containing protein [Chloroflexota bacterium]
MTAIQQIDVTTAQQVIAPDGSTVRILPTVEGASMVHAELPPGAVTQAVFHRTVEELWYCIGGTGRLWREDDQSESVTDLSPGISANIPLGTRFQFRNDSDAALEIVIATVPPWPGDDEAVPCDGKWTPSA